MTPRMFCIVGTKTPLIVPSFFLAPASGDAGDAGAGCRRVDSSRTTAAMCDSTAAFATSAPPSASSPPPMVDAAGCPASRDQQEMLTAAC